MKNILIPTDFSKNAISTINYALKFFDREKCKYYYLHTVEAKTSRLSNVTNKFTQQIRRNAILKLNKLMSSFSKDNSKIAKKQKYILSFDKLIEALKKNTKKHHIDIVVMGTKGPVGLKKQLYGSNTVNTINKIDTSSILMIPDQYEFNPIKKIGFPTDLKKISPKIIEEIKALSKLHTAKIMIMHIAESGEIENLELENLNKLKKEFEGINYTFNTMPFYDKRAEEILSFIEISKIDILAIEKNKHSFIEWLFKEQIIENLAYEINIPLLVMSS